MITPSQPSTIELKTTPSPSENPAKITGENLLPSRKRGLSSGAITALIIFGAVSGLLGGYIAYRIRVEILVRRSHALDDVVMYDIPKSPPPKAFEFGADHNIASQKGIDDGNFVDII